MLFYKANKIYYVTIKNITIKLYLIVINSND